MYTSLSVNRPFARCYSFNILSYLNILPFRKFLETKAYSIKDQFIAEAGVEACIHACLYPENILIFNLIGCMTQNREETGIDLAANHYWFGNKDYHYA